LFLLKFKENTLTTVIEEVRWDSFLADTPQARMSVEAWRRSGWPHIRRELLNQYGIQISDKFEPCWVEAGSAVLWQQDSVKDELTDWVPISPEYGLPITTASQLASYLNRDPQPMRLRPYMQETDIMPSQVAAVEEEEAEPHKFTCMHGDDQYGFVSWKVYLTHCRRFNELPDTTKMPQEVEARSKSYKFYDPICDKGWNDKRPAAHHVRSEMRKPSRRLLHPTVEQMEVKHGNRNFKQERKG
jgi:hypothetical protein